MSRSSLATKNARLDAMARLLFGGYLDLFGGDPPVTIEADVTGRRLATLRFDSPAFHPADAGIAVARPMEADKNAAGDGTARWYRCTRADHKTVVCDGTVGVNPDADLVLDRVSIPRGAVVALNSFTLTED